MSLGGSARRDDETDYRGRRTCVNKPDSGSLERYSLIAWGLPDGRMAMLDGNAAYVADENLEPILDQPVEVPDFAQHFLDSSWDGPDE